MQKKAPLITEDIKQVFENWRVHNPHYSLEKELEKNADTMTDFEIFGHSENITKDGSKAIFYRNTQGWENFHIITIGNEYPYTEEFIQDIQPIYEGLEHTLRHAIPDISFRVLKLKDYTMIGFIPEALKKKMEETQKNPIDQDI